MVLRSHFSQFLLFSEFPMVLPNVLNHCVIPQVLVGQVDHSKRFREYLYPLVYFAAFSIRGCGTWAMPKLLGESGSWKIFESSINSNRSCNFRTWSRNRLTVRDSWSYLHRRFIQLLLSYFIFLFIAAFLQFFIFLATSCVAFLVKTVLHLQFTTQVHSLTLSLICPLIGFQ